MPDATFAGIIAGACGFVLLLLLWRFLVYRREKNDEVWKINVDELHFNHPPEIIGQGAFGVVLLAEYRGTNVAIKRVLPAKGPKKASGSAAGNSNDVDHDEESAEERPGEDEQQAYDPTQSQESTSGRIESFGVRRGSLATTPSTGNNNSKLDFLVGLGQRRRKQSMISQMLFGKHELSAYNMNVLGTASQGSSSHKSLFASLLPWCDETTQRQMEFKEEMRLLSRLRHPCKFSQHCVTKSHQSSFTDNYLILIRLGITTVMGAVMTFEPMMVMEFLE